MGLRIQPTFPSLRQGRDESNDGYGFRITFFVLALIAIAMGGAILGNCFKNLNKKIGLGPVIGGVVLLAVTTTCLRLQLTSGLTHQKDKTDSGSSKKANKGADQKADSASNRKPPDFTPKVNPFTKIAVPNLSRRGAKPPIMSLADMQAGVEKAARHLKALAKKRVDNRVTDWSVLGFNADGWSLEVYNQRVDEIINKSKQLVHPVQGKLVDVKAYEAWCSLGGDIIRLRDRLYMGRSKSEIARFITKEDCKLIAEAWTPINQAYDEIYPILEGELHQFYQAIIDENDPVKRSVCRHKMYAFLDTYKNTNLEKDKWLFWLAADAYQFSDPYDAYSSFLMHTTLENSQRDECLFQLASDLYVQNKDQKAYTVAEGILGSGKSIKKSQLFRLQIIEEMIAKGNYTDAEKKLNEIYPHNREEKQKLLLDIAEHYVGIGKHKEAFKIIYQMQDDFRVYKKPYDKKRVAKIGLQIPNAVKERPGYRQYHKPSEKRRPASFWAFR